MSDPSVCLYVCMYDHPTKMSVWLHFPTESGQPDRRKSHFLFQKQKTKKPVSSNIQTRSNPTNKQSQANKNTTSIIINNNRHYLIVTPSQVTTNLTYQHNLSTYEYNRRSFFPSFLFLPKHKYHQSIQSIQFN